MLIDAGGARMREREWQREFEEEFPVHPSDKIPPVEENSSVTVSVTETHNGIACDCIDKVMMLKVGQELELSHVCHDGRLDKVIAKIISIDPEHGSAKVSNV